VDRHAAPLGHIILILSEPVFFLTPNIASLAEKQQIPILQFLVRSDMGSRPQSTTLKVFIGATMVCYLLKYTLMYELTQCFSMSFTKWRFDLDNLMTISTIFHLSCLSFLLVEETEVLS